MYQEKHQAKKIKNSAKKQKNKKRLFDSNGAFTYTVLLSYNKYLVEQVECCNVHMLQAFEEMSVL